MTSSVDENHPSDKKSFRHFLPKKELRPSGFERCVFKPSENKYSRTWQRRYVWSKKNQATNLTISEHLWKSSYFPWIYFFVDMFVLISEIWWFGSITIHPNIFHHRPEVEHVSYDPKGCIAESSGTKAWRTAGSDMDTFQACISWVGVKCNGWLKDDQIRFQPELPRYLLT